MGVADVETDCRILVKLNEEGLVGALCEVVEVAEEHVGAARRLHGKEVLEVGLVLMRCEVKRPDLGGIRVWQGQPCAR